jgi:hypothetical protein
MVRASGPSCVFSSISAPKFLTTIHSGFDRRPAHERTKFVDYFFFASFHRLSLNLSLTRVTRPRNRFPDMIRMVERGMKVRQYGHILRLVAEDNFLRSAILHHDKHASWYAEKTHSEGFSLYDTYITLTRQFIYSGYSRGASIQSFAADSFLQDSAIRYELITWDYIRQTEGSR